MGVKKIEPYLLFYGSVKVTNLSFNFSKQDFSSKTKICQIFVRFTFLSTLILLITANKIGFPFLQLKVINMKWRKLKSEINRGILKAEIMLSIKEGIRKIGHLNHI